MKIGYFLSCEEFGPATLIEQARMAEEAGFGGLWISDHYHPWVEAQGNSPFVWSVIGGLSQTTSLPATTAVTCPPPRLSPRRGPRGPAAAGRGVCGPRGRVRGSWGWGGGWCAGGCRGVKGAGE